MRLRTVLPAVLLPALALPAQHPWPTPTPKPPVAEPPAEPPPATEPPVAEPPAPAPRGDETRPQPPAPDETSKAAEMLRRALGLEPAPQGPPPQGPPQDPPQDPPSAGQPPAQPPPDDRSQEPRPGAGQPPPDDPTDAARRALERLLPRAQPPAAAPMPDVTGTPEPTAPRAAGEPGATAPPAAVAVPWSATLASRYRLRHGAGATDQDLVARLSIDVGRSESDAVTFHLSARGFADLDGRRTDDPFVGLDHSFGDDVHGRLYRAHLDAHRLPHVDLLRIGRQDHDETPTPVSFDGVRADSERFGALRAFVSVYGGVPVHHFESSRDGDSVAGVAVGGRPWTGARVRLDWMDLRDEFLAVDRHDSLLGARWWQMVGDVQLRGLHTWRDGRPRDLFVGARGDVAEPLHFTADYRELMTSQRTQVTELDPFTDVVFEYEPYRQIGATAGVDLGDHVVVDFGAEVRRLADRSDERAFNREFERWHVDVSLLDLGTPGLSLTVSASLWGSSGEDFRTVAGELVYRPDRSLRAALGSAYDLFRYDAFDDRERVHVRTNYLRVDRRVSDALRVDVGYEHERDDLDEFHLFRLGVTWTL